MILGLTKELFDKFGFKDFKAQISIRDPETPEKYFGEDKVWDMAEKKLIASVKRWGNDYVIEEGEAAFYGPKIDIMVLDAIGREWQLTTVQLDFNQPENFDMKYVGEDGKEHKPAVLHVAIYGSFERFLGILIEHYAGAFPVWLAPVQAIILPVSEKFNKYADKVAKELDDAKVRFEIDNSNESLGKKIRNAELQKIPFMLVVGEKEEKEKNIAVRSYETKKQDTQKIKEFVANVLS